MESRRIEFIAEGAERLDAALARAAGVTRSRAEKLIRDGCVRVGGEVREKSGFALRAGDAVSAELPEPRELSAAPQAIPLDILYEDDWLAVVNKPCGMVVHPAPGNEDGTLVNALLHHFGKLSEIGGAYRPGIVHRLDKDTSGLLLVAKNDLAHQRLSDALQAREMEKHYLAVAEGAFRDEAFAIDAPIARSEKDRKKMAVDPRGREAHTRCRVLEALRGATLLDVRILTGRTHQIRVHLASVGHPVAGDPLYGRKNGVVVPRLMLHAHTLAFDHPATGERMRLECPPPDAFAAAVARLRLP